MSTLTPEQIAARAVGVKQGVPEEFAIDCKAVALKDIEIKGTAYKKDTKDIPIYDARQRDKLRKSQAIMVVTDVFLKTPGPATMEASATASPEVSNGTPEGKPAAPAAAKTATTQRRPAPVSSGKRGSGTGK